MRELAGFFIVSTLIVSSLVFSFDNIVLGNQLFACSHAQKRGRVD